MNEVKHTPGPWWSEGEYDEDEGGCAIIAANTDCGPLPGNPTRGMVAWASELLPEHADECIANARLIAAAPEMLEALKSARAVAQEDRDAIFDSVTVAGDESTMDDIDRPSVERMDAVLREIDAAIAKATGAAK